MGATAGVTGPIRLYRVVDSQGAQGAMRRYPEKSGQNTPASTYLYAGTPVQWASGVVQACAAITDVATAKILGFAAEAGHNLTSDGVGKTLSQGTPVNQSSASIIPGGAWPSDGTIGIEMANDGNEFSGMVGSSNDDAAAVLAVAQKGGIYGLTQDATTKYWYVDIYKATAAAGACVEVVDLIDAVGTAHGRVIFKVVRAAQQYQGVAA